MHSMLQRLGLLDAATSHRIVGSTNVCWNDRRLVTRDNARSMITDNKPRRFVAMVPPVVKTNTHEKVILNH